MTDPTAAACRLRRFSWLGLLAGLGAFAAVVIFSEGGTMEREATLFIVQYTGEKSLAQKVFDPYANDFATYQARELSYLADYGDAQVYAWIYRATGRPLFFPASALAVSIGLGLLFFRGAARTTSLDAGTTTLVFACLASSFVFTSTLSLFYRSGKPWLAVALLALLFRLRGLWPDGNATRRDAMAVGGLALIMGLLDRQGVFYVGGMCLLVAIDAWWRRGWRPILLALVLAFAALQFYNVALARVLTWTVNGYWPDLSYQRIPAEQLALLPVHTLAAFQMLAENAALVTGGTVWSAAPILTIAGALILFGRSPFPSARRDGAPSPGRLRTVLLAAAGLHVLMFALMIARHPFVYAALDHRYWYYTFPFAVTIVFAVLCVADAAALHGSMRRRIAGVLLLCVIVGNLFAIDGTRRLMRSGEWFGLIFAQSKLLARSLETGDPSPELQTEFARLYRHCRSLR